MQTRMAALQGELLERILSNMQDTTGLLLQCSLVSKAWQEAVSRIYPRDLELPRTPERRTPVTPEDVLRLMQWLQRKHSKGYFGQLETLTLLIAPAVDDNCSAACLKGDLLTAFLHSMVAYLNFWHLQALTIHGQVRIETVLPILPTNLRHLCLEPDGSLMPQTVSLAAFAPYTLLETLVIAANDGGTKETPQGSIILDSALPTLQSLTLDPWPFHVHKDQSLVQCLPRVQNLAVHVLSNKTQTMLVSSLKHLTLILHDYSEPFNPHVSQLQVPQEGLQLTRVKDELSHAERLQRYRPSSTIPSGLCNLDDIFQSIHKCSCPQGQVLLLMQLPDWVQCILHDHATLTR